MPTTTNSRPAIYYQTMGPDAATPIIFIAGFTAQLISWHDDFCQLFVGSGFRVIRFDNRDVGLSQRVGPELQPDGYTIKDMAVDAFAVLDDLGLESAHVVGQSMGGMIAQAMADLHPERVRSLNLIYTVPAIEERYFINLAARAEAPIEPLGRDEMIELFTAEQSLQGTKTYPFEEAWNRELAARSYDRGWDPAGMLRQRFTMLRAMGAGPFADPARLTMPVAVIHGREDPGIAEAASIELARLLPHAELHLYGGMAHAIVAPLFEPLKNIIVRTARRAEAG